MNGGRPPVATRFYYGWVAIAVAFLTLGIAVNARTAFSLLYPPILDEFGWERGVTAAIFSVGFIASTASVPFIGMLMDRYGPRVILPVSAVVVALGYYAATVASTPIAFYLSLGLLATGGSMPLAYVGHSMFLPNWFVRRRGLALGVAFSGVGVLALGLFPLLQIVIDTSGWRTACVAMACAFIIVIIPLNLLLQRGRPEDVGLSADNGEASEGADSAAAGPVIVDKAWAERDWTLPSAMRTRRFWWIAAGYFLALYAWYAVQVHQIRFFLDVGVNAREAAFAFSLVAAAGVVGQITIGHFSDRFGREVGWCVAVSGFMLCAIAMVVMESHPSRLLLYAAVGFQGLLGYGIASLFGPVTAEIFAGRRFATILGTVAVMANLGAGTGPWVTGYLYDLAGSYTVGLWVVAIACPLSMLCIWIAAPRKVRRVAGATRRSAR
ncbi:MAG: MFS transporter [Rhizobiaceae bacterium MnEN-MB40S]|nr:MAG: MFS transporter [Rhizobiaceae bacterium MnEN-MB40S]